VPGVNYGRPFSLYFVSGSFVFVFVSIKIRNTPKRTSVGELRKFHKKSRVMATPHQTCHTPEDERRKTNTRGATPGSPDPLGRPTWGHLPSGPHLAGPLGDVIPFQNCMISLNQIYYIYDHSKFLPYGMIDIFPKIIFLMLITGPPAYHILFILLPCDHKHFRKNMSF